MIKTALIALGTGLGVILCLCLVAFVKKTRRGGRGGYKDKHPSHGAR
jgi:hypothetical protein